MARFNEILVGRFNRFAQKYFSMKGGPVAAQLATEVSLMHEFFNGVENRLLEGWNRYWLTDSVPAVAAIAGGSRLRNPVGSNVVAVIESALVLLTLADQPSLMMQPFNADLSVVGFQNNARMDARLGGVAGSGLSQQPTLIHSVTAAGLGGGLIARRQVAGAANSTIEFLTTHDMQVTLLPGDAIQMQSNIANQFIAISWIWRERFLEDSERTV